MRIRFQKKRQIFSQDVLDRLVDRALKESIPKRDALPPSFKNDEQTSDEVFYSTKSKRYTPHPMIFDDRKGLGNPINKNKGLA